MGKHWTEGCEADNLLEDLFNRNLITVDTPPRDEKDLDMDGVLGKFSVAIFSSHLNTKEI